jgi:hypothetical protein
LAAQSKGRAFVLADVRSAKSYAASQEKLEDSVRVDPDNPVRSVTELKLSKDAWIALFCT